MRTISFTEKCGIPVQVVEDPRLEFYDYPAQRVGPIVLAEKCVNADAGCDTTRFVMRLHRL